MLSIRPTPYTIPSYSLTGDLLAFLRCGLQYRYHNRGELPPAKPVQLWFGEFIHAVMAEAYLRWHSNPPRYTWPWAWDPTIREIEREVDRRLKSRGLYPPFNLFCPRIPTDQGCACASRFNSPDHKLTASRRAEALINAWGPHFFPLIAEAEVTLRGIRDLRTLLPNGRADYYEVRGIADVITSVRLSGPLASNDVVRRVQQDPAIASTISQIGSSGYEIIVDYKGMRRPPTTEPEWNQYDWQVQTYAWLRAQQPGTLPVAAGILVFVNELEPSGEDLKSLQDDVAAGSTDKMPTGADLRTLTSWRGGKPYPSLSTGFRVDRSIRVIPVTPSSISSSLGHFDGVVKKIEGHIVAECQGSGIQTNWSAAPHQRNCTACDFKTYCPAAVSAFKYHPTVP